MTSKFVNGGNSLSGGLFGSALIKFCIPLVCFVVLGINQLAWAVIINYDLKADWSDTNNPNGVWAYRQSASILPHNDVSVCCAGLTGAWAPGSVAGNFLPLWAKATGNNYGFLAGDIIVHSVDVSNGNPSLGEANVIWTAPVAGIIDISASLWYSHFPIVRSNDFILTLNATTLTSGTLNATNSDRAHPLTFIESGLNVNAGDVLQLQVQQTPGQPAGSFNGVNLSIALRTVPPPLPFSDMSTSLKLSLGTRDGDDFDLTVMGTLGKTSNGLNPATEDVIVRIDKYSILIPKGSFTGRPLSFHGIINGAEIDASFSNTGPNKFDFRLKVQGANLDGIVVPPEVELTVGDDGGSTLLTSTQLSAQSE